MHKAIHINHFNLYKGVVKFIIYMMPIDAKIFLKTLIFFSSAKNEKKQRIMRNICF